MRSLASLGSLALLGSALAAACSDPPPPVDVTSGALTARITPEPAQITLLVDGHEVWKTESGGGDGTPPHGFASISTKSLAIQQDFGSYRFDENADQTTWQGIDKLANVEPTATGASFELIAGDHHAGTGTLAFDGDQHVIITLAADSGDSVSLASPLDDHEHLVGLGGQSFDVDERGQHVPLFVQEDGIGKYPDPDDLYQGVWFLTGRRHSTHTPMPMLLSSRGYALAVDTDARAVFDLGHEKPDSARYEAWQRTLALHVWLGDSPRTAFGRMIDWVGKPARPPAAVFSPWVDAIYGSASVRQVAQALRDNGISSSVIWTEDWRVETPELGEQRADVVHAVDRLEVGGDGIPPARLDRRLVEEARVEVADLALLGAGVAAARLLDDVAHRLLGLLCEHVERAVPRLVARDLGARDPLAVDVPEQVVARSHRRVEFVEIDAGVGRGGLRAGSHDGSLRACLRRAS